MRNLIDGYISDSSTIIKKLNIYINNAEYEEIADLAHALDGSSRSIGAKRLAKIAGKISKLSQSQQYHLISKYIIELKTVFHETKLTLTKFMNEKGTALL